MLSSTHWWPAVVCNWERNFTALETTAEASFGAKLQCQHMHRRVPRVSHDSGTVQRIAQDRDAAAKP